MATTPGSHSDDSAYGNAPTMLLLTADESRSMNRSPTPSPSASATSSTSSAPARLDLATYPRDQPIAWTLLDLTTVMDGREYLPFPTIATLALNEASRLQRRGFFHVLPDSADRRFGHVGDVLFSDHIWSVENAALWDAATWLQRMELSAVWPFKDDPVRQAAETRVALKLEGEPEEVEEGGERRQEKEKEKKTLRSQICALGPTSMVMPICTRFLIPLEHHVPTMSCLDDNIVFYHQGKGSPGNPDQLCYTRAQDDESAWLLLFDAGADGEGKRKRLFSVRSQAFQHRAHCAVKTSPDLRYETFTPYRDPRVREPLSQFFCAHEDGREQARQRLGEGRMDGLGDVVRQLVRAGEKGATGKAEMEPETWGPVWWEWGMLRERVKENERRRWCAVFGKKARRKRKDRVQDEKDRVLFGF